MSELDLERAVTRVRPVARLVGYSLLALVTVTLYLVIPLMVTLRSLVPNGLALVVLVILVIALGEWVIVRVLVQTSPQRETAAQPRERRQAFSGPAAFDVDIRPWVTGIARRELPSIGRALAAGPDELVVRVGSTRWRNYRGVVNLTAFLPSKTLTAKARILRAEDVSVRGRVQCVLHLRLIGISQEDEHTLLAATS